MDSLTSTLRAVSDPTRRAILDLLRKRSRSVTDLAQHFSMSRPAVSKHLGILRQAELVISRREGRQQIYELDASPLAPARQWLEQHAPRRNAPPPGPAAAPRRRKQPRRPRQPAAGRDDWRCW